MARDKEPSRNPVGRPPKPMPPPIPDTPENVARAVLFTPPKRDDDWDFLREFRGENKDSNNPSEPN